MNTVKVAVTGAAGQIGYALLFRIASGSVFGRDSKVELQLLELEPALPALEGVKLELDDCAFPLLQKITTTSDAGVAFKDTDWILLVGAAPRKVGMERNDLLRVNGGIFVGQGKAIEEQAGDRAKILVIGNPCNTNCMIAMSHAPSIPKNRWFAMTALDENRARRQLAERSGSDISDVKNLCIWGNHSATQYPDFYNASIHGKPVTEVIQDEGWLQGDFIKSVQQRGAAIIKARGASSAASAANAAIEHMKSWNEGTDGQIVSMAVHSDGSYGIEAGLIYSFPCLCEDGKWQILQGLKGDSYSEGKMKLTEIELIEERDAVAHLLPG